MSRLAIGYGPSEKMIDRPAAVFIEAEDGVWVQRRGDPGPLHITEAVSLGQLMTTRVEPGEPQYFDAVLDSFSTSFLIRTVTEFEPATLTTWLTADEHFWDVLPKPHAVSALATSR